MSKPRFEFDVFVSHNQQQKSWVRELVEQWRGLQLKVFFDEDSIAAGDEVLAKIERGLQRSRHIVFVITPTAVGSKWVALESACTLHADVNSRQKRLIPLKLEPTPEAAIRISIRRLKMIDLTVADPRERSRQYHSLLRLIGVKHSSLPDPPVNRAAISTNVLNAVKVDQVESEELKREFIEFKKEVRDYIQGMSNQQEIQIQRFVSLQDERDRALQRALALENERDRALERVRLLEARLDRIQKSKGRNSRKHK